MNMKKRILAAFAALTLIAGLTACSEPAETPAAEGTTAPVSENTGLLDPKILKVGVEVGYPPFEYYADDGVTPVGCDIDLAKELAKRLGVEVDYINTAWDAIFEGLKSEKYDVIISAVTINADRQVNFEFSSPYIVNWQCIVVKKGSDPVTSILGLDGLKVGYQGQTTSDEYLGAFIERGDLTVETSPYEKVLNCFDDLKYGRLDAVICDSTVAVDYVAREPDQYEITWLQETEPDAEPEQFGVCIKKGNTDLQGRINEALAAMNADGTLEAIRNEWFS